MFDMDQLRWNKIMICTDADVDGFQIRTLILTMIYRLMPKLIDEGKVYIAESPLYEVTCKTKLILPTMKLKWTQSRLKSVITNTPFSVQRVLVKMRQI